MGMKVGVKEALGFQRALVVKQESGGGVLE
jgi:hypothetical protein